MLLHSKNAHPTKVGWAFHQLAELTGNAVLFTEGSKGSLADVIVCILSGGLAGQQRCRVGALADGDGDLLHIVGIGRNFDAGFGMGFLILFPD